MLGLIMAPMHASVARVAYERKQKLIYSHKIRKGLFIILVHKK